MALEPHEFEEGEDVTADFDRTKPRGGIVVSARLTSAEADRVLRYAEEHEHTVSQVTRLALRAFLDRVERPAGLRVRTVPRRRPVARPAL